MVCPDKLLNDPIEQFAHVATLVAPVNSEDVPARHGVQAAEARPGAYEPAGHVKQAALDDEPLVGLYFPSAHATQSSRALAPALTPKRPAGQRIDNPPMQYVPVGHT